VPGEIVSEDLIGVHWIPAPFSAAGIGIDRFGSVVVDGIGNGIVDGVGGSLDIYDGLWLRSVFVLEEKCEQENGDDYVGNGFHNKKKETRKKKKV